MGLLDVNGYWGPLLALLDHAVEQRFVLPEHRHDLLNGTDPDDLLDALAAWRPSHDDKWIDRVGRSARFGHRSHPFDMRCLHGGTRTTAGCDMGARCSTR